MLFKSNFRKKKNRSRRQNKHDSYFSACEDNYKLSRKMQNEKLQKICFDKQEKLFPVMYDYPNFQKNCVY